MEYAELPELIAQMILHDQRHERRECGPSCLCWQLREIPSVKKAIQELECKKVGT